MLRRCFLNEFQTVPVHSFPKENHKASARGYKIPKNWSKILPNWQKESWQTFEEISGYVRQERVNK
jgi:hypothetical protein